jgi:F-type H+-transporting ATPase subunit b
MFTPEAMAGYVSTAILTIVNLLVTYFILKRFLFKPILNVLRKRKIEVESELSDAAEKLKLAEEKLTDATGRLSNSNHEAATILTTARSQAEIQRESIMSDAKREIAGMYTRADAEINRMRITMLNDVRDEVADLSVAIASKVIGQAMDDQRQRELIEHFMDDQMKTRGGDA